MQPLLFHRYRPDLFLVEINPNTIRNFKLNDIASSCKLPLLFTENWNELTIAANSTPIALHDNGTYRNCYSASVSGHRKVVAQRHLLCTKTKLTRIDMQIWFRIYNVTLQLRNSRNATLPLKRNSFILCVRVN